MEITKNYSFAMSVLYQTLRIVLLNATNNLAALAAFKSKYTTAYINTLKDELKEAEELKSDQARKAEHEALRVTLVAAGDVCTGQFQDLKRYIADAFPGTAPIMWDAAGWNYYRESTNDNFDKCREMTNMMAVFIAENEAKLLADGYMPAAFIDTFEANRALFNKTYDDFLLAIENAHEGAVSKISANNAIKDKVADLCADAVVCFRTNDVKKKLFSMEAVAALIQPAGSSTLVVELKNEETSAVVSGYSLTNVSTERTVTGDDEGRAEMGQQAAGSTTYRIEANGFPEHLFTVNLETGTKLIKKISLMPLVVETATEAVMTPTPDRESV